MYDARAYLAAQEPPVFIDQRGRRHVGVIIGADTWLKLQASLRVKNADGSVNAVGLDRAMWALVTAFFPHPWWKIWRPSVAWMLWQLPIQARMRAIWDFMRSQAKATGVQLDPTLGTSLTSTEPLVAPSPDLQISGS